MLTANWRGRAAMAAGSAALALAGSAAAQTGASAGGAASINSSMLRCSETKGNIAIETQDGMGAQVSGQTVNLSNIVALLRSAVLQSNCFRIGLQGNNRVQERLNALKGQTTGRAYRPNDVAADNQQISADYYMQAIINFTSASTERVGPEPQQRSGSNYGAVAGALTRGMNTGILGNVFNAYSASQAQPQTPRAPPTVVQNGRAQVTLEIYDVRSNALIASATSESSATTTGHQTAALQGTMADTPGARALANAIDDAYRQMVPAVINYQPQKVSGHRLRVD